LNCSRNHDVDSHDRLPRTFIEYLRSFGPGLIVVLTWLGAGDIVTCGVAGGDYGYALMWAIVVSVFMRFLFVSLIAKYHLCNERGEGVVDGLARLHPVYAPALLVTTIIMAHIYGSYTVVGLGETWVILTGRGQTWQWAAPWTLIALALILRPKYRRVEIVFKLLLVLLTATILACAVWSGPSPTGILHGALGFALPEQKGIFDSMLLVVAMMGAIGGSLSNLVYPYFIEQKGWRGPRYRRVQTYDFLLAVVVMIVINLSVWTLGAELVYGSRETISDLPGLARLLSGVLGEGGRVLFLLGVFAAVFTSLVGNAMGLGYLASHCHARWRTGTGPMDRDFSTSAVYMPVVVWMIVSPLVWTIPGMPGFITLTVIGNSVQVVLIPFLAIGLWWITASSRFIGMRYRNRWWENLVMGIVFVVSLWATKGMVESLIGKFGEMF